MRPAPARGGSRPRAIVGLAIIGLAIAGLAMVGLSGCSASPAPVALDISVFQLRSDYAGRGAQIEITNPSARDLTITSATFSSAWFAATMSSPSAPSELPAKRTIDFRIRLAQPHCAPSASTASTPVVTVRFSAKDGSVGRARIVPQLPFDSLTQVHAQDCAQLNFERIATISVAPALRFDPQTAADGRQAALVDVTFTPTGATGSVTLDSTEDTTLLAQREGTIRTIGLSLSAHTPPTTITLDYLPAGCLQHRVAEDKVGTLLPLRVDAGGATNALIPIAVPATVKAQLLDWVGSYCGW